MPKSPTLIAALLALLIFAMTGGAGQAHEGHVAKPAASTAGPGGHAGMVPSGPEAQMAAAGRSIDATPPKSFGARLMNWLGKWHPSVVHFPIALFVVAGLIEARSRVFRRPRMTEATRLLIGLGALSASAAVLLGWMAMGWTYGQDDGLHTAHQTLGSAIAVLALGAWWAHERWLTTGGRGAGVLYAVLLTTAVAAIGVNGFLGGALVRGLDHLTF